MRSVIPTRRQKRSPPQMNFIPYSFLGKYFTSKIKEFKGKQRMTKVVTWRRAQDSNLQGVSPTSFQDWRNSHSANPPMCVFYPELVEGSNKLYVLKPKLGIWAFMRRLEVYLRIVILHSIPIKQLACYMVVFYVQYIHPNEFLDEEDKCECDHHD